MLERKSITLEKVLEKENIKWKDEYTENRDMVIAKNNMISVDGVAIVKQVRKTNKLVILNSNEPAYFDYQGEEYLLPLFLVSEVVLTVVAKCVINWITNKMIDYNAQAVDNQSMPKISIDIFRTEKSEMISIKAEEAESVVKILKELRDQDDSW